MNWSRQIALRWAVLLIAVAMLLFLPTREFLKVTFMLGVPVIFVLGYMAKQRRKSLPFVISGVLLLVIGTGYLYLLYTLPQRIEVRRIVMEGSELQGQGRYQEAIQRYRDLEALGKSEDMHERIAQAEKESYAAQLLAQAELLQQSGQQQKALEILNSIPPGTRSAVKAGKLKKEWGG